MQQPDPLPPALVTAPGTLGTAWHVGMSRATHARSALSACTRQSAYTYCKAPLRPHRIRSMTATVGNAHVRSQALASSNNGGAHSTVCVGEPTTGDVTTPFDRRPGRRDVLALLCSIRAGVSVHGTLPAQPRYGTTHSSTPSIRTSNPATPHRNPWQETSPPSRA